MRQVLLASLLVLVALTPVSAKADEMLMARVAMPAEIVFAYLESSIEEHGYSIAHIQLCDGGMSDFGFKSDFYRVIFFGKIDEARMISEDYPELVSYIPLKIAVIAERDETLLTVLNPQALARFYSDQRLQIQFGRWENDLRSIFQDVHDSIAARAAAGQGTG